MTSEAALRKKYLGSFGDRENPDWEAIEREYRAGQLSNREIARLYGASESNIRKQATKNGWTRDLSGAVRNRVREALVREGAEAADAVIVDAAAARGVDVVRSHRLDIDALRKAAAALLGEIALRAPPEEGQAQGAPLLKVSERSRVLSDLSAAMARLIPLERQAFGLDEDKPDGSQPLTVVWEGMPAPAYD